MCISSKKVCFKIAPKRTNGQCWVSEVFGEAVPHNWAWCNKRTPSICRQFNWRHDELVDVRGSETVTRWPSWCRNEQFTQVFLSSTMKTVIHCYGYPELNTVYHIEPLQIVSHCMMYSPLSYLHVFVTTRAAAFNTRCSLSVTVFGDPNNRLHCYITIVAC